MNEDSRRIAAIVEGALLHTTEREREQFIAFQCHGDPELAARVRAALAEKPKAGGSAAPPLPPATVPMSPAASPVFTPRMEARLAGLKPEEAGDRIGHYKLLQLLGEGGFGSVWVAEQEEPMRRRVALKIVKIGMDTKEVIARFEQERQALAMMDHPNIARVLDGGMTPTGRPFFVMELVRGVRITEFCDQSHLTIAERLRVFTAVCSAVQHAHQKGIIHRDLKPSNILVALHDGAPIPKVIDFGVAKAMQQRLTDKTVFTQFEQIIGTPLYMSPEQADLTGLDVDTRSDIYSLGVLLYELLTGGTPFATAEHNKQNLEEIRRCLREQDPLRLPLAFGNLPIERQTRVAAQRRTEARRLPALLSGDLEWIAMKALEKDRARRYDTAAGFAADIERHLHNEPVIARPPSQLYRVRRFVRRHKVGVLAGSAVALALLAGLAVSLWQGARAAHEAERAKVALGELRETAPSFAAHARLLVTLGEIEPAIEKLGYAIKLRPDAPEYLLKRGALWQSLERLDEAAADFRRALALDPGNQRAKSGVELCERLLAAPREPGGGLTRASLVELRKAMIAEGRPAGEQKSIATRLGQKTEVALAAAMERLRQLPNPTTVPLEDRLKMRDDGSLALDLTDTGIADLSPLAGLEIGSLKLKNCSEVRSLEGLRRMPLRELDLEGTSVTDLSPLAGIQTMEKLVLSKSKVADLSPLHGMPLVGLKLKGCSEVRSLEVLRRMPLSELDLEGTGVADLAPLAENRSMETLTLNKTGVANLSPLRGMIRLEHLEMSHTSVTNLTPLAALPLTLLDCSYTPIIDFTPLAKLPLKQLWLQGLRVGDLDFVRKLPLKSLSLIDAREVRNVRALAEVQTLEMLALPGNILDTFAEIESLGELKKLPALLRASYTLKAGARLDEGEPAELFWQNFDGDLNCWRALRKAGVKFQVKRVTDGSWSLSLQPRSESDPTISDLSILAGANISVLDLTKCTEVADLGPLRDLPLTALRIAHTKVTDLSPLQSITKLRELWMADTPITNLAPLRGLPLKRILMDKCRLLTDVSLLKDMPSLEEVVLPEKATDESVKALKALPNLQRISYSFVLEKLEAACGKQEFWKEQHDLEWLRKLRAVPDLNLPGNLDDFARQTADGTWRVKLSNRPISDLAVLKGARISDLKLNGTGVTDLRPLASLPLRNLRLDSTPAGGSVAPLSGCPTLEAIVLPPDATDVLKLKGLTALKMISFEVDTSGRPTKTVEQFWTEYKPNSR